MLAWVPAWAPAWAHVGTAVTPASGHAAPPSPPSPAEHLQPSYPRRARATGGGVGGRGERGPHKDADRCRVGVSTGAPPTFYSSRLPSAATLMAGAAT